MFTASVLVCADALTVLRGTFDEWAAVKALGLNWTNHSFFLIRQSLKPLLLLCLKPNEQTLVWNWHYLTGLTHETDKCRLILPSSVSSDGILYIRYNIIILWKCQPYEIRNWSTGICTCAQTPQEKESLYL